MSSSSAFAPDHHHLSPSEQLCYVHCNFCDTVLAVSVPCTSLFKTVTVRCGHCTNLLSVNMRGLLLPAANQLHLNHSYFSPQNLLEEIRHSPSNLLINQPNPSESLIPVRGIDELPKPPVANRRYVDTGSPTLDSSRSWKSMEMEIQSSLEKLLDINNSMSQCAASAAPAASVTQKLARHRDILQEFTQEFRRIKGNINSMREHAELLGSVRDDISDYKASGGVSPRMQLLRERAAIDGSISHIDDVISQAQATRVSLASQRALFGEVQGKVKLLGDKFPVIRGLIGSIRRKRSRDTLILSAVIAACTLFIIIYWLSK